VSAGVWAIEKRWEAGNLHGASFIHFRNPEFYSAYLVNRLNFNFNFPGTSLEITASRKSFSWPTLDNLYL
jgi:hypothetical protein